MSTTSFSPKSNINKRAHQEKKKTKRAKRACYHCKKAKTSCSNERPCTRCKRLDLADSCIDTPRSDISRDEKQLWDLTLKYLTNKTTVKDKDEANLKQMLVHFARTSAGSGDIHSTQKQLQPVQGYNPNSHLVPQIQQQRFQISQLEQQNTYLTQKMQGLLQQLEQHRDVNNSLYSYSLLSMRGDLAYSRWTYPHHNLLDYNRGFLELSLRSPAELKLNEFSVCQLYHKKHIFSCSAIFYLLCEGLVDYVEMNQEWCTPRGPIPVKTYLNVNLCEHHTNGEVILYSKRSAVPFPRETLFQPLDIALSKKGKAQGLNLDAFFDKYCADQPRRIPTISDDPRPFKLSTERAPIQNTNTNHYSGSPFSWSLVECQFYSAPTTIMPPEESQFLTGLDTEVQGLPELGGDSIEFLNTLTETYQAKPLNNSLNGFGDIDFDFLSDPPPVALDDSKGIFPDSFSSLLDEPTWI